ncbi:MAG: ATP synthase F1 subunit epsilon [Oligoflexia bacterium]|nr:ATP synthase F1 subunit epsilon [Oligoflexia bacterium]
MAANNQMQLSVVTPEKSIVTNIDVASVVLPGELGQMTLLPGHINLLTTLGHGVFGYRVKDEWQIAFLAGGFAQVFNGSVTVLAETMEMEKDLDLAKAEANLKEIITKLAQLKAGSSEYTSALEEKGFAESRVKAAQKKIH